jgi:hypothetical protein
MPSTNSFSLWDDFCYIIESPSCDKNHHLATSQIFLSEVTFVSLCVATFVGLHCVDCQMHIFFMFVNFVVCLFVQLLAWTFESSAVRKQSWHWQQQCHLCAHG